MSAEDERKLFVAGLTEASTEESLRGLFTSAGFTVESIALPRDRQTGLLRGYAFVTLSSPDEAERARSHLDGMFFGGRNLGVRRYSAQPPTRGERPERGPGFDRGERRDSFAPSGAGGPSGGGRPREEEGRTLYVTNLPFAVDEKSLREVFGQAGIAEPVSVHLPVGQDGRSRGFGFITLPSAEAAQEALSKAAMVIVQGRPCNISLALPKGQRPERTERPARNFDGGGGFGGGPDRGDSRPQRFFREMPSWSQSAPDMGDAAKQESRKRKEKPKPKPSKRRGGGSWDDDDFE